MFELDQMVVGYGLEDESFGDESAMSPGMERVPGETQDTENDFYSV